MPQTGRDLPSWERCTELGLQWKRLCSQLPPLLAWGIPEHSPNLDLESVVQHEDPDTPVSAMLPTSSVFPQRVGATWEHLEKPLE